MKRVMLIVIIDDLSNESVIMTALYPVNTSSIVLVQENCILRGIYDPSHLLAKYSLCGQFLSQ